MARTVFLFSIVGTALRGRPQVLLLLGDGRVLRGSLRSSARARCRLSGPCWCLTFRRGEWSKKPGSGV